jgi:polygalacturonase
MNDMNKRTFLSLLLCVCSLSFLHAERVDMQQAGADIQGRKLNTTLINSTIDRLNANGGGTLFFPTGTYLTGSIHMKSNITLELEAGATLKFSENFDDFLPYVEVRHEGIMMKSFQPLIYAVDAENITIKGEGTLDGQGKAWWTEFFRVLVDLRDNGKRNINKYQPMFEKENDLKALYAETNEDWHGTLDRRFFRPPFIHPIRCKNVRVEGVKIINSPFWTVNPEFCDNVTIKGITIHNVPSPNTDGIDPESCEYIRIIGVNIHVGDDCIAMKASKVFLGMKLKKSCEHTVIRNCLLDKGHGGIVIGSEMSGGVKDMVVTQCLMDHTDRGLRVKTRRGRGNTAVIVFAYALVALCVVAYFAFFRNRDTGTNADEKLSGDYPV